jgi:hypothetical protein
MTYGIVAVKLPGVFHTTSTRSDVDVNGIYPIKLTSLEDFKNNNLVSITDGPLRHLRFFSQNSRWFHRRPLIPVFGDSDDTGPFEYWEPNEISLEEYDNGNEFFDKGLQRLVVLNDGRLKYNYPPRLGFAPWRGTREVARETFTPVSEVEPFKEKRKITYIKRS